MDMYSGISPARVRGRHDLIYRVQGMGSPAAIRITSFLASTVILGSSVRTGGSCLCRTARNCGLDVCSDRRWGRRYTNGGPFAHHAQMSASRPSFGRNIWECSATIGVEASGGESGVYAGKMVILSALFRAW